MSIGWFAHIYAEYMEPGYGVYGLKDGQKKGADDDGDEDAGERALVEPADERGFPPAFLRCARVVRHSESEFLEGGAGRWC